MTHWIHPVSSVVLCKMQFNCPFFFFNRSIPIQCNSVVLFSLQSVYLLQLPLPLLFIHNSFVFSFLLWVSVMYFFLFLRHSIIVTVVKALFIDDDNVILSRECRVMCMTSGLSHTWSSRCSLVSTHDRWYISKCSPGERRWIKSQNSVPGKGNRRLPKRWKRVIFNGSVKNLDSQLDKHLNKYCESMWIKMRHNSVEITRT